MSDTILVGVAALLVAALAAGLSHQASTPPGSVPGAVPGLPPRDKNAALRHFLTTVATAALDGFGSDKWFQVTEGRKGATYSNCGDLCHAVLWWAGARAPDVNRQSDGRQWIAGNIAKLRAVFESARGWHWYPAPSDLEPGDAYLLGDHNAKQLEHVGIVLTVDGATVTSADYGQAGQGGAVRTRHYTLSGNRWRDADGRILTARGNALALAYPAAADPPRVVRSPAVNAAAAAVNASRAPGNPNA